MISRIGVIYEDTRSLGFLRGLRDRLGCDAKLLQPPAAAGRTTHLTKKTARRTWRYFQAEGVDLVVRFVDADRDRWQDVKRRETAVYPSAAHSVYICGVAVENVEEWLSVDRNYIAEQLGLGARDLDDADSRSLCIKNAIDKQAQQGKTKSDVVADIVRDCPSEVFRRWLDDEAFRDFYTACRQAAQRADCDTPNELGASA